MGLSRRAAFMAGAGLVGCAALFQVWLLRAPTEQPGPHKKEIWRLLSELKTITAAEDLIVLESPLVKTIDKDSLIFAFRDEKPVHYGRAGYDLLTPTAIDRKTVLIVARKRAHPAEDIPDPADEYAVESCDIDARRCSEVISPIEFRAVVGKRRVTSIKLFRRQQDLIVVIGSSPGSRGGPYGTYSIFRKFDGGKLELLKDIDGLSYGPYSIAFLKNAIIFMGVIVDKGSDENKNAICQNKNYCIFSYDLGDKQYYSVEKLLGISKLPLTDLNKSFPENGIFYESYYFDINKYFYVKSDVYSRYRGLFSCNTICIEVVKLGQEFRYFSNLFKLSGKLNYSSMLDDGSFIVEQFDDDWVIKNIIDSRKIKEIELINLIIQN